MADTLGGRISEYRRSAGVTQDHMAEKLGVTSQAVSKWENDLSCPDITLLPAIADFFGVTIDSLLRGERSQDVMLVPEASRKDFNKLLLRVKVLSSDGDMVNVNLPLQLIKACMEMGMSIPDMGGNKDILKNIDFTQLLMLAEIGAIGKLVEVKSADGDLVEIVIE